VVICGHVLGLLAPGALRVGVLQPPRQYRDDGLSDLVLQREDIHQLAVVTVGPKMVATRRVDKLRRDPNAIAGLANAALHEVADIQVRGHVLNLAGASLVGE
jgi:hypothetical protein